MEVKFIPFADILVHEPINEGVCDSDSAMITRIEDRMRHDQCKNQMSENTNATFIYLSILLLQYN